MTDSEERERLRRVEDMLFDLHSHLIGVGECGELGACARHDRRLRALEWWRAGLAAALAVFAGVGGLWAALRK